MLRTFKNFKGAHALRFEEDTRPQPVKLRDVAVGDTFMREGAICLRLQDSIFDLTKTAAKNEDKCAILNMQTANAWATSGSDEVYMVDAKLVVTKIHKPETV